MIPGLRGSLLSHDAMHAGRRVIGREAHHARRLLMEWRATVEQEAGPAWGPRMVFDRVASPFCRAFGLEVVPVNGEERVCRGLLRLQDSTVGVLAAFGWGQDPRGTWRDSVRGGIAVNSRWCYTFTGPILRIYDGYRTHSRRFAEFDLALVCQHAIAFEIAWMLFASASGLDEAAGLSERHRAGVRDSLQLGVHEALQHLIAAFTNAARRSRRRHNGAALLDESLVVIYRVLFLLFAEARGLVPAWHPVFRESYTIEALRGPVETLPRPRGIWEALQAIARLAHRGCRAGTLRVPPFNGRLFSPSEAPLADTVPLDDAAVRQALLALTTRGTRGGRERIAYGDLGVEQLGGVYERVLDYAIGANDRGAPLLVKSGRRRATGSFYTPRSLTEYLVRRTLAPLVENAGSDDVLSLRVLDPSMGSGAFLVAACRYLALAYESALIREGAVSSDDLSDAERAGFRRVVAQRCLYGVDLNAMAVQLARLSLWLVTLSGDRPLTFFDHHLRCGNSLVGAGIADVRRRLPGARLSSAPLPLFDEDPLIDAVRSAVVSREYLRTGLEETLDQVRRKERLLADLQAEGAPLARWRGIADLWCAGWFDPRARQFTRATYEALIETVSGGSVLSHEVADTILRHGRETARTGRFFHWELEFPELFHTEDGAPAERPGFDAIIGNPPWEMLRGDSGDAQAREQGARAGAALTRFVRNSGIYCAQGGGQANLYQMFVERTLALVRRGGRLGLVLPSGFASDHGCGPLRRHVLASTAIDSFVIVENREALFPIHRGLKFVVMTLTKADFRLKAEGTTTLPLRAGIRSSAEFDRLPESGPDCDALPVSIRLIQQISGDQLAIPELRTRLDARIASHVAFSFPPAGSDAGWGLRFGRELNATDDRKHFNERAAGLPVLEGKHLQPFTVDARSSRRYIDAAAAERILGNRPFDRPRLAYRDVAASTNKLTLIAAVLPAGTVTTHTLFCLKTLLDEDGQQFVAGVFNSFVANYMVRLRVTTHVTVAIVERLPLPVPSRSSPDFITIIECARVLASGADLSAQSRLQAATARLYRLDAEAFAHLLSTFPLVDERVRAASMEAFIRTV